MRTIIITLGLLLLFGSASAFQAWAGRKVIPRTTTTMPSSPASISPLFVASPASSGDSSNDDDDDDDQSKNNPTEEWTKKRLHNTAAFRSMALLGALAAAGLKVGVVGHAAAAVHVLSFATWFGSVAYTTFIAGITMFQNLPRQTFGKLQAKLFPKYFALGSITLVLQLVTLRSLPVSIQTASTKALLTALVMTLANQLYLEPLSTNNMMRRYELEANDGGKDTDEYKKLKASFGKFHGLSSLTNLIALCAGVVHAVYVAGTLMIA